MPRLDFERLAIFGDSLSDAGEIQRLTGAVLQIPFPLAGAGYAGVMSNGPVYSQTLPTLVGVGAEVFAVSGARAIGTRPLWQILELDGPAPPFDDAPIAPLLRNDADRSELSVDVNLGGQVDRFLATPGQPDTAAAFLIGLLDLAALDTGSPALVFDAIARVGGILDSTADAARRVVEAGAADTLIFYGFPDTTFVPGTAELGAPVRVALETLIGLHLSGLQDIAKDFADEGIPSTVIDFAALTRALGADPDAFGFTAKGPILFGSGADPDIGPPASPGGPPTLGFPRNPEVADLPPDRVQFYDELHPTTAMHDLIAVYSDAWLTRESHVRSDLGTLGLFGDGDEFVLANGGSDIVALRRGPDIALAGLGDDTVFGGGGKDILSGGSGDDSLYGGYGKDLIAGGPGDDMAKGGHGPDVLIDGAGSDLHLGRGGDDVFVWTGRSAPDDADTMIGGTGADTLYLAATPEAVSAFEAAQVGRSAWDIALGHWKIPGLGLSVAGIETLRLYDAPSDIGGASPDMIEAADLWGLL
ncbi:hypothetical protein [Roseivivax sediminis]|uniref:Phospholipase/lecithinase/hemolysin n=1 Tax=Roseivivax sediminis TaxID=936889 RepID=A0A1I2A693_9RHOB|nr:hypothetical protein [Roseivivax sediminis]SFE38300.1 Phospholipase/lecithinase/hemolysin [Roseivivax sediminis]